MMQAYSYEIWDGKKVLGHFNTPHRIFGRVLVVPYMSVLKQRYGQKIRTIEVPIILRQISDDGVTFCYRRALDVRKKSNRQIEILKGHK